MPYLVTKALLDLHDKYDGQLGLLDERWAPKADREAFSIEQTRTLGEYIDKLGYAKVDCLSQEFRMRIESRIKELEELIDPELIALLRARPILDNDSRPIKGRSRYCVPKNPPSFRMRVG